MINAPDRSGPDLSKYSNATVDGTPNYPHYYTPLRGFIALTPAATYTPGVVKSEILITGVTNSEAILGVCETYKVMITNKRIAHFPTTWVAGVTVEADSAEFSPQINWNEQKTYLLLISTASKDAITVKISEASSGVAVGTATLTVTDIFAGNPVLHFGFPTDSQIANGGIAGGTTLDDIAVVPPAYQIAVTAMQAENAGPTDVTVLPAVAKTTAEVGYWVGNLWATHARTAALPCTFALVTGSGDTNNASFSIRGTNLHVAGTLTAGAKSIRVQAMDRFGYTYAKALTVTVS